MRRTREEASTMQAAKGGGATVAAGPRASGRGSACTNSTTATLASAFHASSKGSCGGRAAITHSRTAPSKRPCLCIAPFGLAIEGRRKSGAEVTSEIVCSTKVCGGT